MPVWLIVFLMIGFCYRFTRLIVRDTLPPVLWARDRLAGGWRKPTEAEWRVIRNPAKGPLPFKVTEYNGETQRWVVRSKWSPDWLAELITCPWCASGWVSAVTVATVTLTLGLPLPFLIWGAVWGGSSALAAQKWS